MESFNDIGLTLKKWGCEQVLKQLRTLKLPSGESVIIREAVKTDAQKLIDFVGQVATESNFLTFGPNEFGISLEQEEEFLDSLNRSTNKIMLIALTGTKIIGNLSFEGGSRPRIEHVGELGVSVCKKYWNNGIGTTLVEELIYWAQGSKIIRKINLRVRTDNINAIRVYEKLGFVKEGTLTRDFFINGRFYDSIQMGLCID
ncbi:MAG TPA: GNAT family N-acetyltransferase [Natronincola sp.]|nr:GNAT family N-acetyltransferase [Natronincola sp.]